MNLTDKTAIRIYKRLKCVELVDSIDSYPEDERDGRDDLQFLADEISYFRYMFEADDHYLGRVLNAARKLLWKTDGGKIIPRDPETLKPKLGYEPSDIANAKSVISEYKQLKYYEIQLSDKGYYGQW